MELIEAIEEGDYDLVKDLLEKEAEIDESAIFYALKNPKILELLLKYKANPNVYMQKFGGTPLTLAIGRNYTDSFDVLLKYGADPNFKKTHYGPIDATISFTNVEALKKLLEKGATIDYDSFEQSLSKNQTKMVEAMIPYLPTIFPEILLLKQNLYLLPPDIFEGILKKVDMSKLKQSHIDDLVDVLSPELLKVLVKYVPKEFIEVAQESLPKDLTGKKYPRSGRPITQMKRLLGEKKDIPKDFYRVFNSFENTGTCFCLTARSGVYDYNTMIPITRYGKSAGTGYYGKFDEYVDVYFTWYYVEPDSDFVLYSRKTLVSRNKIHAFILLGGMVDPDPEIRRIADMVGLTLYQFHTTFASAKTYHPSFYEMDTEVNLPGSEMTNFFRNKSTGEVEFEFGILDFLDEVIGELAQKNGFDVVIMTHQPGNYGRLVSECLDVRKRQESFKNIFRRKDVMEQLI